MLSSTGSIKCHSVSCPLEWGRHGTWIWSWKEGGRRFHPGQVTVPWSSVWAPVVGSALASRSPTTSIPTSTGLNTSREIQHYVYDTALFKTSHWSQSRVLILTNNTLHNPVNIIHHLLLLSPSQSHSSFTGLLSLSQICSYAPASGPLHVLYLLPARLLHHISKTTSLIS